MNLYQNLQETEDTGPVEITLEELENIRNECKTLIEVGKAAKALSENNDFKKVIMEGYFVNEGRRLAGLLSSGRLQENQVTNVVNDIRAIGSLTCYLRECVSKATMAENHLVNCEQAYNEYIEATS
jgi:hypothetical protein